MSKKLSEELRHCLEDDACGDCQYHERETKFICQRLLQKAYEAVKRYEEMFPFKIGDTLFVDSKTLPTENMEFDKENIPKYFEARVVSVRKNCNGRFVKLAVRSGWYSEWFDPECGHDCAYYNTEKYFTYPFSALGKTIFLTKEAAEKALKEMEDRKNGEIDKIFK